MPWDTPIESAFLTLDANYEFIGDATDAIIIQPTPGELFSLVFNIEHDGAGTDNVEIQVLGGHRISDGNGLDGATAADDLELDTGADAFTTDDDMNGHYIIMTSGDEQGEGRVIIDSVAADDGVNLSHALSGTPSAAETYALYAFSVIQELLIDIADPAEDVNNAANVIVGGHPFIAVVARMSGGTDTPRIKMTYAGNQVNL